MVIILVKRGVVIVTEKKVSSPLIDDRHVEKVAMVCENIGLVYSGMGPDARLLLLKARKLAQVYRRNLGENPPVAMLVRDLANVFQDYTQSGGVRPFGVSFLVAGVDEYQGTSLYQVDPSGTYWAWKAAAIGKNFVNAKSFLEKRYSDELDLEDAIHTAIQTLRQVFEGQLTPNNIQIGIADATSGMFHLLTPAEVEEHLTYAQ